MTTNVPLDSSEGKERLARCNGEHHAKSVIQVWEQQSGRTLCGFQTLACIINSVEQTKKKDIELFGMVIQQYPETGIKESTVLEEGLTMDEFIKVASVITAASDITTSRVYVMHTPCCEEIGVNKDDARRALITILTEEVHKRIACNYHMTTAGQEPYGGHFSPLVA